MKKYIYFFFLGGGGARWGSGGSGGQGRCERRSEVFVKIQKKKCFFWGGSGRRGQVGAGESGWWGVQTGCVGRG